MRTAALLTVGVLSCSEAAPTTYDATVDARDATEDVGPIRDATVDAGPPRLAELRCGAPEPWAEPLRDYLDAGERASMGRGFLRAVQDLAVYQDRLYLGYGDANINLGRVTPIEVRAFTDDAQPQAATEFRSDEEQLEQYRELDGDLWIAGVDAAEDAWLGNVYWRPRVAVDGGVGWVKRRTVLEGVHVHDLAWWRGALWAVGSGSSQADWTRGQIDGHLWRSDDRGASFTVAARHSNMGRGDARWVRILGLRDALLLFGYRTDAAGRATIVNVRWDGATATPLAAGDPLRGAFALETFTLPSGGGFVRGAASGVSGLAHRAFRVDADGGAQPIAHLSGRRVLDVSRYEPTGEVLVLSAENDEYPAEPVAWSMRVEATTDFERFTELASFSGDEAMRAVAAWRGRLYFGADSGSVWRCDLAR